MIYQHIAASERAFVQQLAVAYVHHGYWYYVTGCVPRHKDVLKVDAKLMDRYGVAISKWAKARRKRQGLANVQYLRHDRFAPQPEPQDTTAPGAGGGDDAGADEGDGDGDGDGGQEGTNGRD